MAAGTDTEVANADRTRVDREIGRGQHELLEHLRRDVSDLKAQVMALEGTIAEQREVLQDQNRMIAGLTSVAEELRRELRLSLSEAANFRALDTFMTALKSAKRNGGDRNGEHAS